MAAVICWVALYAPDIGEAYQDMDDLENDAVDPQFEHLLADVAELVRRRGWEVADMGVHDYDDRPPDYDD